MSEAQCIAVDWGTSSLRACLLGDGGQVLNLNPLDGVAEGRKSKPGHQSGHDRHDGNRTEGHQQPSAETEADRLFAGLGFQEPQFCLRIGWGVQNGLPYFISAMAW